MFRNMSAFRRQNYEYNFPICCKIIECFAIPILQDLADLTGLEMNFCGYKIFLRYDHSTKGHSFQKVLKTSTET